MAHHVQQRSSSVYTLNPPVQTHQYQPNRRYVDSPCLYSSSTSSSSISNPSSNNRYKHYYHDQQQQQQQLLANRTPSRMETIRSSTALQHYYQDFHHAHPIMLPLSDMRGPLGTHIPAELRNIMGYIGGHYYSLPAAGPSQKKAIDQTPNFIDQNLSALCSSPSSPLSNGYHVQCLLLLGICAYARDKFSQANTIIHQAIELALKLGMHRDDFARANGLGQLAMEEMWRRTYWELYVVAGLLSGLRGQVSALQDTESDVLLPCDEVLYKRPEVSRQNPSRLSVARFPLFSASSDARETNNYRAHHRATHWKTFSRSCATEAHMTLICPRSVIGLKQYTTWAKPSPTDRMSALKAPMIWEQTTLRPPRFTKSKQL